MAKWVFETKPWCSMPYPSVLLWDFRHLELTWISPSRLHCKKDCCAHYGACLSPFLLYKLTLRVACLNNTLQKTFFPSSITSCRWSLVCFLPYAESVELWNEKHKVCTVKEANRWWKGGLSFLSCFGCLLIYFLGSSQDGKSSCQFGRPLSPKKEKPLL